MPTSRSRTSSQDRHRRRPGLERPLRRLLDDRAVHHRIAERDADLDARRRRRPPRRAPRAASPGRPPVMYGTSSLRPAARCARSARLRVRRCGDVIAAGSPSSGRRPCRRGRTGSSAPSGPAATRASRTIHAKRVRALERRDDALGAGQQLERVDHLGVGDRRVLGAPDRRRGTSARDRRPGSRARPRSTGPPAPGRTRPASGSCACRARRRARRGRRPLRRPARRRPAGCGVSTKPLKMPIAFEPPPTHATTTSGSAPSSSRHCARASSPITRWNSRTIHGYGCGPITEPRQ